MFIWNCISVDDALYEKTNYETPEFNLKFQLLIPAFKNSVMVLNSTFYAVIKLLIL